MIVKFAKFADVECAGMPCRIVAGFRTTGKDFFYFIHVTEEHDYLLWSTYKIKKKQWHKGRIKYNVFDLNKENTFFKKAASLPESQLLTVVIKLC